MLPTASKTNHRAILLSSLVRVTDNNTTSLDGHIQHSSCYLPSLLALGSQIFSRPEDLATAKRLLAGCIWAHDIFDTGLMPEGFYVLACEEERPSQKQEGGNERESRGDCEWIEERWLKGVMSMDESITDENVRERVKELGLPEGVVAVTDSRFLLRYVGFIDNLETSTLGVANR